MATFLASLLIGQAYDAYVASGYASREQALNDQKLKTCPYLPNPEVKVFSEPEVSRAKYRPSTPPDYRSKFLLRQKQFEQAKLDEKLALEEESRKRAIEECERPGPDPLFGRRVHAWVLLFLPSDKPREPTKVIFIEPASGESCEVPSVESRNRYLAIESVWNDKNYWVNMQNSEEGCQKLEWNLGDVRLWEHLLAGEPEELRNAEPDDDEAVNNRRNIHMKMPRSYVDKIEVSYAGEFNS